MHIQVLNFCLLIYYLDSSTDSNTNCFVFLDQIWAHFDNCCFDNHCESFPACDSLVLNYSLDILDLLDPLDSLDSLDSLDTLDTIGFFGFLDFLDILDSFGYGYSEKLLQIDYNFKIVQAVDFHTDKVIDARIDQGIADCYFDYCCIVCLDHCCTAYTDYCGVYFGNYFVYSHCSLVCFPGLQNLIDFNMRENCNFPRFGKICFVDYNRLSSDYCVYWTYNCCFCWNYNCFFDGLDSLHMIDAYYHFPEECIDVDCCFLDFYCFCCGYQIHYRLYLFLELQNPQINLFLLQLQATKMNITTFLNYYQQIANSEFKTDLIKAQMTKDKYFDAKLLFRSITRKEAITINDMKEYLDGKVACNSEQMCWIFMKFDHCRQGEIMWRDFQRQLQPLNFKKQKANFKRKKAPSKQSLSFKHTKMFFIDLIMELLKSFRIFVVYQSDFQKSPQTIIQYFSRINLSKTGFISPTQIKCFFKVNKRSLTKRMLGYLIHSIRNRCYWEINLEVFCQNLNPFQAGFYRAYEYVTRCEQERVLQEAQYKAHQAREEQEAYYQHVDQERQKYCTVKEASMVRELELQQRIEQQIQKNQFQKFNVIRKYKPHLTYEQYLLDLQLKNKQNETKLLNFLNQQKQKTKIYNQKMMNVKNLYNTLQYQGISRDPQRYNYISYKPSLSSELEDNIRLNHTRALKDWDRIKIKYGVEEKFGIC